MALVNEWIGYVDRSYQQAKESIIARLPIQVPEMTDHSESNIFIKMVSIFSGILEQIGYYVDNKGRETYLSTQQKFASAVEMAAQYDYRIHGVQAASVDVTFTIDAIAPSDVTIPVGTQLSTEDGTIFLTSAEGIISIGQTQVTVGAKQQELVTNEAKDDATGVEGQQIVIGSDVVEGSVNLVVGGSGYTQESSFIFSLATDLHFIVSVNANKEIYAELGDGINGNLPTAGQTVVATYYRSLGASGNVGAGQIVNIDDTITLPGGVSSIDVSNVLRASGGEGVETLAQLKKNLPISIRVNDRAVTEDDYSDLANLVSGVAKAKAIYDCGKIIDLYMVPNGGGVASQALLDDVEAYIEPRKIITTTVNYRAAGSVEVILDVRARIAASENNLAKATEIKNAILSFMSVDNQEIDGIVYQSDIYEIIENISNVRNSNIVRMVAVPFATVKAGTTALVWTRTVLVGSTARTNWRLKYVGSNQYQVYRENQFRGVYTIGATVSFAEITFSVTAASYVLGDEWTFVTYPISADISLNEPSIAVSFSSNVTVRCTGGV